MIPKFEARGYLPRGLHQCSSEEFYKRFCDGEKDSIRMKYKPVLKEVFASALTRGASSIIIGGSFVSRQRPNDIDCIIIVPNEHCIPTQSETIVLKDYMEQEVKLDILYILKSDKESVYRYINLFAKDRWGLDVGLVEIILDNSCEGTWNDYYEYYNAEELFKARESYINRQFLVGNKPKGIVVTIHGINTNAQWNNDLAPIVSSNGWIFAPYSYGNVVTPLISDKKYPIDDFREWISELQLKYKLPISVIAHSYGTYILGKYIEGFDYEPPVSFENIVLAGCILNENYDWEKAYNNYVYKSLTNIISPNDPWVKQIDVAKKLKKEVLYGKAGINGFTQQHDSIFQKKCNIFDHSSMLRIDVFESIISNLNVMHKFTQYSEKCIFERGSFDIIKNY